MPQTSVEIGEEIENKLIAWNGLLLHIPQAWDARVSGKKHLVFEKDFQPQLQIRWEQSPHSTPRDLQKRLTQLAGQLGGEIPEHRWPKALRQLQNKFGSVSCYQKDNGMVTGGLCLCAECQTLILFQLLSTDPSLLEEVCFCLTAMSCHKLSGSTAEELWRIQDFSLVTPSSFILRDYTFGAGLTRLSFCSDDLVLQTCTLGPADTRLRQHSLEDILITLTDCPDLDISIGEDNTSFEGHRSPTILKQIVFRLHREKPFIRAKIWHDTVSNRILTVVLSSNRPIPQATTHEICRQYEIVQKKSTA